MILPYLTPSSLRQTNGMRFRLNAFTFPYIPIHCLLVYLPKHPLNYPPNQSPTLLAINVLPAVPSNLPSCQPANLPT